MKIAAVSVGCLLGVLVMAGCSASKIRLLPRVTDDEAQAVVARSIEAMGGWAAWDKASSVQAWALVASYDSAGRASLTRQQLTIYPRARKISAVVHLPAGLANVTADEHGNIRFGYRSLRLEQSQAERLGRDLAMILYHALGPLNLIAGPESAVGTAPAKVAGEDVIRVGTAADGVGTGAYYFDGMSGLLRFVTRGEDESGAEGTTASYEYMLLPDGLAFPNRVRIVRIGKTSLIGDQAVLEVEFSAVAVRSGIAGTHLLGTLTSW